MFGDGLGCWHVLRCHNVIKSSIGNIYQALVVVVLKHSAHEISQLWYWKCLCPLQNLVFQDPHGCFSKVVGIIPPGQNITSKGESPHLLSIHVAWQVFLELPALIRNINDSLIIVNVQQTNFHHEKWTLQFSFHPFHILKKLPFSLGATTGKAESLTL